MSPSVIRLSIGFLILGMAFYAVERLFPAVREKPLWRRDSGTDLVYWFFTPLVTKVITRALVLGAVVVTAVALGRRVGPELANGFGPVARQPRWAIAVEMLVLGDFIGYWTHRWFHGRRLWRFHAIHHCSTRLDWLSSVRLHPVNDAVVRMAQAVALVCLGFPLKAMAAYVPFLSFYAIMLHANVNWSFGPFRYLIANPLFHRWHHTSEEEGLDKNFAGLIPLFDILFRTFYVPEGRYPERFGVTRSDVPGTFLGQLAYPFRRSGS